jgi:micrococcal nuclease
VSVADGNTLTLRVDQKKIIVRLAEIYAPERRQAFGLRSRVSLAAICHSKSAQIRVVGHDRNGRAIGYVSCNGVNGNAEQVRRVLTWVYERDSRPDALYAHEDSAKAQRLGLWIDEDPISPWEWRKKQTHSTTASLH